jgi:hypothetical protein
MNFSGMILDSIKEQRLAFGPDNNRHYSISDGGKIAKLYPFANSGTRASYKYHNLIKILELNDPNLRAPIPFEVLPLHTKNKLESLGVKFAELPVAVNKDYMVWAVVMQRINGIPLPELGRNWGGYKQSLEGLMKSMLMHGMVNSDIKEGEIICLPDNYQVALVDFERVNWNLHSLNERTRIAVEQKYMSVLRQYRFQSM